jgi:hypothetical protein
MTQTLTTLEWIGIVLIIFNGGAILFTLWFIWAARMAVIAPADFEPTIPSHSPLDEEENHATK